LLQNEAFEKYKTAKSSYLDAIDKLSEIDPIHAYYLGGNTSAIEIIERLEPVIVEIQKESISPEKTRDDEDSF